MSPFKVLRDHIGQRVAIDLGSEISIAGLDRGGHTRAIPVAAIEDLAVEEHDFLAQTMGFDIGNQVIELGALYQREQICQRMKFKRGHRGIHDARASTSPTSSRLGRAPPLAGSDPIHRLNSSNSMMVDFPAPRALSSPRLIASKIRDFARPVLRADSSGVNDIRGTCGES
jgi:hypothetical protein